MMTSSRSHGEITGSFTSRRDQSSRLSISDPSHHVTEAIGTLYGEDDDSGIEGGRPLSFVPGLSYQEQIQQPQRLRHEQFPQSQKLLARSTSDQMAHGDNGSTRNVPAPALLTTSPRNNAHDQYPKSPSSPTLSLRDVQADQQFPLTNIDNPSDIAQELSNLQALRRLSMDVGNSIDPDMPPMSLATMPAIAPRGDDDENDPSRLLWVPARVHPELAPTEFRSFLEKRLQSIRRRSGSGDSFLTVGHDTSRNESGSPNSSFLRRKKSMLSRQIDNSGGRGAVDYSDDAERLERQQSSPELSLDELVKDPARAVQKLAQESHNYPGGPDNSVDDMPILPMAPGGGLRRSTRTTYRKGGSLRSGDKASFSRRVAQRQQNNEPAETTILPTIDNPLGHSLARVQSEPITENYSRPTRSVRRQNNFSQEPGAGSETLDTSTPGLAESHSTSTQAYQDQLSVQVSSTHYNTPILQVTGSDDAQDRQDNTHSQTFPQRSSSQPNHTDHVTKESLAQPSHRSVVNKTAKQPPLQQQHAQRSSNSTHTSSSTLGSRPSPLPAGNASRTDTLTFIPTLTQDDKKMDKKTKKDRDDESSSSSIKSGSAWKWFKGVADDKEKRKDESKKSKSKALVERVQDNARLDMIQTSIDRTAVKGRESLVLDRDNIDNKPQDERKKESHRKSDSKKEKDGSIFSSIFGGSKKKEDKEKSKKSQHFLQVPEDPPYKPLQPDVDYDWSRFPLLEERAIYRMAHIKLANPRRSLHSQVLLSNFMYSYLAIVQAMHPQMNVPISPQQKRLEEEARRKQQEEKYLAQREMQEEQDAQQSLDQYNFDYHRMAVQYADSSSDGQVEYVDDAQIYEDEHGNDHHHDYDDDNSEGYGQDVKEYFEYSDNVADHHDDGRDGLW